MKLVKTFFGNGTVRYQDVKENLEEMEPSQHMIMSCTSYPIILSRRERSKHMLFM